MLLSIILNDVLIPPTGFVFSQVIVTTISTTEFITFLYWLVVGLTLIRYYTVVCYHNSVKQYNVNINLEFTKKDKSLLC
jgi:hypothetical protein